MVFCKNFVKICFSLNHSHAVCWIFSRVPCFGFQNPIILLCFNYFESVLYNVQLVNTQPVIIDLRCHFSWTYQLWIYQLWITSSGHYYWNLIFYGIVIECSVSLLKLRKQFRLKKNPKSNARWKKRNPWRTYY